MGDVGEAFIAIINHPARGEERMKTQASKVDKLYITDVKALDPITVYLEDIAPSQGMMTVVCYGKSWTGYWGGMGENCKILDFIISVDSGYIARRISHNRATKSDDKYLMRIIEVVQASLREMILP
jgi:hypothetical protein